MSLREYLQQRLGGRLGLKGADSIIQGPAVPASSRSRWKMARGESSRRVQVPRERSL